MPVPVMTYDTLTADIIANAQRTDAAFVNQVPNFIQRAITRIYTEANDLGLEIVQDPPIQFRAGNSLYRKPPGWKKTLSLSYTDQNNNIISLRPCSYEAAINYWPNSALTDVNYPPVFYTHYDQYTQFFITPTPAFNCNTVHIYVKVPIFSATDGQTTNFLTERYPSLLFYGCMSEAMTYLKDDQRLAVFEKQYGIALGRGNVETQENYSDRSTKREEGA